MGEELDVLKEISGRIGYDESMPVCYYRKLRRLRTACIGRLVKELRAVKERNEIEKIKKAVKLTKKIFQNLEIGRTEIETARNLKISILKKAEIAFEPIVAAGKNGFYVHHRPAKSSIKSPLLIDFGIKVDHYCSDFTRTICLKNDRKILEFMHGQRE